MADISSLSTAIAGIRHATEIARLIRDAGPTLADAEQKLKLAELLNALADAKIAIAELKDNAEEKDSELKRMREALTTKAKLKHSGTFYTSEGDTTPYCPRCWEVDHRSIHVAPEVWEVKISAFVRACPECKVFYKTRDADYTF